MAMDKDSFYSEDEQEVGECLLCSCVSDEEEILDEGVAKQGEPSQVEHAISDDNDTVDSSRESSSDESLK